MLRGNKMINVASNTVSTMKENRTKPRRNYHDDVEFTKRGAKLNKTHRGVKASRLLVEAD